MSAGSQDVDPARLHDRTPEDDRLLDALAFRSLLAQVPEVLYVMDKDEYRFLRISAIAPRLFGTEELGDPVGHSVDELFQPDSARSARIDHDAVVRSGTPLVNVVREICFPNGAVGYGSISVFPLHDADGNVIATVGYNRDVTKQRYAELALESRTQRLEEVLGRRRSDPAQALETELLATCERAAELTGAAVACVMLKGGDELREAARAGSGDASPLPDLIRLARRSLDQDAPLFAGSSGKARSRAVAVPVRGGDGPAGVLALAGPRLEQHDVEVAEVLALVLSSALSHRAEVAALERFRAIFEGASIGIVRLAADGRPVEINPMLARMLGFASGVPLGHDFHETVVHPDDRAAAVDLFNRLLVGEIDEYELQARLVRNSPVADREVIWCHLKAAVERDAAGQPAYAIVMIEDVTEQRQAEEHLRQSQKLEAIGQLAAGIAHDFNNLLTGVLGWTNLARARTADPETAAMLGDAVRAAERAATLTKQLLAYGRRQRLERRTLQLNELILGNLSTLAGTLGERIEIRTELDPALLPIEADPTQIRQILLNLGLNARDAMPAEGELRISTENVTVERGTEPLDLAAGSYVRMTVADTGVGMSAEVRGRAFEPFFTTKGVGEGSGLGLSSVYGIVKQSRGDIEVQSEPGAGTSVVIYLPAVDGRIGSDEIEPKPVAAGS